MEMKTYNPGRRTIHAEGPWGKTKYYFLDFPYLTFFFKPLLFNGKQVDYVFSVIATDESPKSSSTIYCPYLTNLYSSNRTTRAYVNTNGSFITCCMSRYGRYQYRYGHSAPLSLDEAVNYFWESGFSNLEYYKDFFKKNPGPGTLFNNNNLEQYLHCLEFEPSSVMAFEKWYDGS